MATGRSESSPRRADLTGAATAPPGRPVPRVVRRFVDTESAGGIALLVAALAALVWANSPWRAAYESLWHTVMSVQLGRFILTEDLRHWVNDGLMALFFFVVGVEIKRELVHGDLREPRVVAMPVIAALGGMAVPALLFLLVTSGGGGSRGWGIPMATDIAFAVGVVTLLGRRVPASLKLFLLTLAIVDDIGAIVVIAVFYASDIRPAFLAAALGLVVVMAVLRRGGVQWLPLYVVLGVGVWLATQASGVHATIAGVVLGLLAPAPPLAPAGVVAPAVRLEDRLHPWTSFLVLPVFALANAGVVIRADSFDAPATTAVALGVVAGLVVGKLVGITAAVWLAVRSGFGRLPEGATWSMLGGIAAIGGIGFTVSLFITELAYEPGPVQDAAKLGVLGASTIAALLGAAVLLRTQKRP